MLSFLAALAIGQPTHADKITIHTKVYSLAQAARIDLDGAKVEKKKVGTYTVGLELAITGMIDELVKSHEADELNYQNVTALLGQKISRDFFKKGQTQTVEILPLGASTTGTLGASYGLDVVWRFGNNDRVYGAKGISHHFDIRKGEAGMVELMMDGQRWLMEITLTKDL